MDKKETLSTFSISVRVYYEDTDAGGVVYYANYLRFMERARTEWLRHLGFEQDELFKSEGVVFAVRSAKLEFIKAARFNDILTVSVRITDQGKASVNFEQIVTHDDEIICRGEIRLACLDVHTFVPRPIPDAVAENMQSRTL